MKTITLTASLSGTDTAGLVAHARRLGWVPDGTPQRMEVDYEDAAKGESLDAGLARTRERLEASYLYPELLVVDVGDLIKVGRTGVALDLPAFVHTLAELPFEVAAFDTMFDEWVDGSLGDRYLAPGFGGLHVPLGWGAAFRGAGHDLLASRRWLDSGPWKLWRGPGDVSLVQFHDLDADAETALAQARPGHRQLANRDTSGFLQRPFVYELELSGLHDPASRTMKVVVLGRDLSDLELREWAAARVEGKLAGGAPVDAVAFVFPDQAEGQGQLARLWRYGHQVWVVRDGEEIRLDDTYQPPPWSGWAA